MPDAPVFHRGEKMVDVLFASNRSAQMAADRMRVDKPIESMLGLMSNSPEMLEICAGLSKLSDILPVSVDDLGRTHGNGVAGNFYGVRHVPGYPMKDGTYPLTDNLRKRESAGLANHWVEPWHRELFRCFTRVFFEDLSAVPLRLRKGSSSVNPLFTKDPDEKKKLALEAMTDAPAAGDAWLAGDFKKAWLTFHIGGCYYVVYRNQNSDKITWSKKTGWEAKDRWVADMEYAISGGERGRQFVSSKSLDDVDFSVPEGFFRTRLRTAMGLSFKTSACQMPVFQAVRSKLYSEYAFSFHHTTRMQKEEKIRGWDHSTFADVSDHDINWAKKLFAPEVESVLKDMNWAPWGIALLIKSLDLPIYISSPSQVAEGEPPSGHVLFGDWRKPDINVGLPSGNPGTDVWGSLGMAYCYCLAQIIHTAQEYVDVIKRGKGLAFVRDYLKGTLPIACMSKSDDAVMLWKGAMHQRKALVLHHKMRDDENFLVVPYVKLSYEMGGKFLGDLAIYDANRDPSKIIMTGDIRSDVFNAFVPEYTVDSKQPDRAKVRRSFPGLAWTSRTQVYGSHPSFGVVTEHIERVYRNVTGESYQAYRKAWEDADKHALSEYLRRRQRELRLGDLSIPDLEVLADSEKLQYKYAPMDINQDVVSISEFRIELDVVAPYLQSFTNQASVA